MMLHLDKDKADLICDTYSFGLRAGLAYLALERLWPFVAVFLHGKGKAQRRLLARRRAVKADGMIRPVGWLAVLKLATNCGDVAAVAGYAKARETMVVGGPLLARDGGALELKR